MPVTVPQPGAPFSPAEPPPALTPRLTGAGWAVRAGAPLALVVTLALAVGAAARAQYLASADFPLGEGGLFVAFSEAIRHNHFRLPWFVQYGGVTLPFAYPPAAFYLAALVSYATGLSLLSAYYWLPIGLNALAIPAFAWLAAAHARERTEFVCATLLYAAVPESFVWQITGGGAPRALAALFTLVAAGWALRVASAPRWRDALGLGALVGLAIVSHLEWGMTAAIAVSLALLARGGARAALRRLPVVALTAAAAITPWLATVLQRHGLAPFVASSSASQWDLSDFLTRALTGGFLAGVLTWPALIGAAAAARRGEVFALGWAVLMLWTTPRMALAAGLAVPAALLAGRGVALLAQTGARRLSAAYAVAAGLCLALVVTPLPSLFIRFDVTRQLRPEWRQTMRWIAGHTPAGAKFVVLTDADVWWDDSTAEWFPQLAARSSLTTAQGLEWLAPGAFDHALSALATLKAVQRAPPPIVFRYLLEDYCEADYVAIFSPGLARAASPALEGFALVHRAPDAVVLQRTAACPPIQP